MRLVLGSCFPEVQPDLIVWHPHTLPKHGGGTVNSEEVSHSFHTLPNHSTGRVTVCHSTDWEASMTTVGVVLRGVVLWLEAYEAHLATGRKISRFLSPPPEEEVSGGQRRAW